MKLLIRILIMALVAIPGLSIAQEANGPQIVVGQTRFDAGKVVQGSQVSHVFDIKNEGNKALVIERIQAG